MERMGDEERASLYREQKGLLEGASKGDIGSMNELLGYVLKGKAAVPDPVTGIMLSIEGHIASEGFDLASAGHVLERILAEPSAVSSGGRPLWSIPLRISSAHYALRVLAEHPEFGNAGYTPQKLIELADGFNNIADGTGYCLTGKIEVIRAENQGKVVYDVDFTRRSVTRREAA